MGSQAYGQGVDARQNALNFAPQLAGLSLAPGQNLMDIGGQQQAMQQARLNAPFAFGQNIQNLIGEPITLGSSFGIDQSTSSSQGTGPDPARPGPFDSFFNNVGTGLTVFPQDTSIVS